VEGLEAGGDESLRKRNGAFRRWSHHALERFQERYGSFGIGRTELGEVPYRIEQWYRPLFDRLIAEDREEGTIKVAVPMWSEESGEYVLFRAVYDYRGCTIVTALSLRERLEGDERRLWEMAVKEATEKGWNDLIQRLSSPPGGETQAKNLEGSKEDGHISDASLNHCRKWLVPRGMGPNEVFRMPDYIEERYRPVFDKLLVGAPGNTSIHVCVPVLLDGAERHSYLRVLYNYVCRRVMVVRGPFPAMAHTDSLLWEMTERDGGSGCTVALPPGAPGNLGPAGLVARLFLAAAALEDEGGEPRDPPLKGWIRTAREQFEKHYGSYGFSLEEQAGAVDRIEQRMGALFDGIHRDKGDGDMRVKVPFHCAESGDVVMVEVLYEYWRRLILAVYPPKKKPAKPGARKPRRRDYDDDDMDYAAISGPFGGNDRGGASWSRFSN